MTIFVIYNDHSSTLNMAAKLPVTYKKLVAKSASSKFRDVVSIVTASTPTPGEGQILIKNKYVGINASDINFTAGRYGQKDYPLDCGLEAMGEVVACGTGCTLKVGQVVMCLAFGAFAEYMIVPANTVVPLPDLKPEYLPIMLSGNTASIGLDKVGELKAGETVLVTAAAGGTGQFAVQVAKLAGCHVIGTCSTEEKVKFLKDLGCDRPVNYKKENLKEVLKKEYPKGVDVVYETIGGEMFDTCIENLAIKGRLIVIGYITGYESEKGFTPPTSLATLPRTVLSKSAAVRGFYLPHYTEEWGKYAMKQLAQLKEGKLKTFVDKGDNSPTGPFVGLDKVVDAVDYLYSKKSIGKIIVEIN